jgi:hypothetical protein
MLGPPMDRLLELHARPLDRLLERVEVDADEVDRLDPVLPHGRHVLDVVAQGEQPAMDLGVKRLHPPVHHLREASNFAHVGDG